MAQFICEYYLKSELYLIIKPAFLNREADLLLGHSKSKILNNNHREIFFEPLTVITVGSEGFR